MASAGDDKISSPEQAELALLEELFKDRYTENDKDYMTCFNTPLAAPPCVDNWYARPKRTYDYSR